MSLRETKRAATRRALAQTAFEMVRDRGFNQVTVDEITASIPVSRRTFSNYFANKEEAVAALPVETVAEEMETWQAPPGSDALSNVSAIVDHMLSHDFGDILATMFRLSSEHPAFRPYGRDVLWSIWETVGDRLRQSLRLDGEEERQQLAMVMGALYGLVSSRMDKPTEAARPEEIIRQSLRDVMTWLGPALTQHSEGDD